MPLQYDPEFAEAAGPVLQLLSQHPRPPVHDVASRRAALEAFALSMKRPDLPEDIERIVHQAPADDSRTVPIYHYRKKDTNASAKQPAIFHLHGGGYISLRPDQMETGLVGQVQGSGIQILSVDYRLSPESKYPAALDDAWAALQWVYAHAEELSIDTSRIAVLGESAGGGLAAALALLARDRALSPPLAKQILIYPMLDDRTVNNHAGDLAFWDANDNLTGWTAYLGKDLVGTDKVPAYAAPARVESVEGLPPLYMEVPQLDMFVHESAKYATRFLEANIPVEFHILPGLPHGFEGLAPMSGVTRRAMESRIRVMTSL